MKADYGAWHRLAQFVSDHQQECGRPHYACVFVAYSVWAANFLCTRLGQFLLAFAPGLFGVRALLCTTCFSVAAQSWWGEKALSLMDKIKASDQYEILFFSEQLEHVPETHRKNIVMKP